MTPTNEDFNNIKRNLDILDGLVKAFKNLDSMFDELIAEDPKGVTDEQQSQYEDHCDLLMSLHTLAVKDLLALRDNLVCHCTNPNCDV